MLARTGLTISAAAVALVAATPGFAQEAGAFAERLKAVTSEQGLQIAYDEAVAEGEDITLRGLRIEDSATPGTPQDVTFEGVSGSPSEGYTVERVPYPDVSQTRDNGEVSVTGIVVEGLQVAGTNADTGGAQDGSEEEVVSAAAPLFFDRAAVAAVTVEQAGTTVFSLENAELRAERQDDGTYTTDLQVPGFTADFTSDKDPAVAETMEAIGYPQLSGSLDGDGTWDPTSGRLALDDMTLSVEDAGDLTLDYALGGYTPAFIAQLGQLQRQMEGDDAGQATGMAMMGLLSQLSLENATISFDDQSLTNKLLTYYGEQQGLSREEMAQNLVDMLPAVLSYVPTGAFRDGLADAVETYLDDPQSFEIAIAPSNPIPATQIVAAAMGAPDTLPKVLALVVNVNGDEMATTAGDR